MCYLLRLVQYLDYHFKVQYHALEIILGIVNIILEIHDVELWHGIKYYAEARVLIATISV